MTSPLRRTLDRSGAGYFFAGWTGFAVFGILAAIGSHADLSYAVFHVVVGAATCTWYALTSGRAAPLVGGLLGVIFTVQMTVFLGSDLTSETSPLITAADAFGLVAGILIIVGAVIALRRRHGAAIGADPDSDYATSPTGH